MRFSLPLAFGALGIILAAVPALTDRLAKTPLGTGYDSGFTIRLVSDGNDTVVESNVEATDVYLLRMKVRGVDPAVVPIVTELNGRRLLCRPSSDRGLEHWFEICEPGAAGKPAGKFAWSSGDVLAVRFPAIVFDENAVEGWILYPDKNGPDSDAFSGRRVVFEWSFWICAILSLLVAIGLLVGQHREEAKPITAAVCIDRAIDLVGMADKKTTKQMRQFLRRVMSGMTVNDALKSVGIKPDKKGKKFAFFAFGQLKGVLVRLTNELSRDVSRIP